MEKNKKAAKKAAVKNDGPRKGLPKLRCAALKALGIDVFNAEVLELVAKTGKVPAAKRAVVKAAPALKVVPQNGEVKKAA